MTGAARPRVLIVEDNFLVNETIVEACREWGHEAVGVLDAAAAAAHVEGDAFGLLIVDHGLPGGESGEEVLRHYRSRNPSGAALVISGMPAPSDLPARSVRFLQKPFTVTQLGHALSLLDLAPAPRAVA
ncbi:response regulator [Sphingomonas sp. MMS24-J13]|uniref:response regulator n=1 Tax=Sphingomonas sp. MMS24-J13 TaxID=3238686 RepID=UPI00384C0726